MKKTHILLLLASLIVIAGCTNGGTTSSGRFIGGDIGLIISFIEQEPPAEVLDDGEEGFDITLLLQNIGEATIAPGDVIVTLQNIDRDSFSLTSLSKKSDEELERRQRIGGQTTEPEETEVRFIEARYKHDLDASFEVEMRADVCYVYTSLAVTDLCLKRDATERRTRDQCEITNNNVVVDNSGAPVHIENVIQRSSGSDEIKFTFDIVRTGSGDVFELGTFTDECVSNDDTRSNEDKVFVSLAAAENLPISCSRLSGGAQGTVELINGRRSIRCDVDTSGLQEIAFLRRLNIRINYFYKDSATVLMTVVDTEQLN